MRTKSGIALYKKMFRKNSMLFWCFMVGLVFYMIMIVWTFSMIADLPPNIQEALESIGMNIDAWANAMVYTADLFFGQIIYMFAVIAFVMIAYRLGYKVVDNTSLSAYLVAGISRTKYVTTAMVYLLTKLLTMFTVMFFVGWICFAAIGSGFSMAAYLNVVFMSMLATGAVVFISFFLGTVLAGKGYGMGVMIAVPVAFLLFFMLGTGDLEFLSYLSVFGWIDTASIGEGTFNLWWLYAILYVAIIVGTFVATVLFFRRKQLSI